VFRHQQCHRQRQRQHHGVGVCVCVCVCVCRGVRQTVPSASVPTYRTQLLLDSRVIQGCSPSMRQQRKLEYHRAWSAQAQRPTTVVVTRTPMDRVAIGKIEAIRPLVLQRHLFLKRVQLANVKVRTIADDEAKSRSTFLCGLDCQVSMEHLANCLVHRWALRPQQMLELNHRDGVAERRLGTLGRVDDEHVGLVTVVHRTS